MCLENLLELGMRRDLFGRVQYSRRTLNHAFPLKCFRHATRSYILIVSKDVARMLAVLINISTWALRQSAVFIEMHALRDRWIFFITLITYKQLQM
jgi:hypothetical protein